MAPLSTLPPPQLPPTLFFPFASLSTAAYLTTQNSMEKVTTLHFPLFFPSHFIPFPQLLTQEGGCWPGGQNPALEFTQTCIKSRHLKQATPVNLGVREEKMT